MELVCQQIVFLYFNEILSCEVRTSLCGASNHSRGIYVHQTKLKEAVSNFPSTEQFGSAKGMRHRRF